MKKVFLFMALLFAVINVYCQIPKQGLEIEAGCSMVDETIGPRLGARYCLEMSDFFTLSASLSSSNGFRIGKYDVTNAESYYSGFSSVNIGIGSHVDFLKVCLFGLTIDGGSGMYIKRNVMYFRPVIGGTAKLSFKLNQKIQMGLFCNQTWMHYSGFFNKVASSFGICWRWNPL
ncbi:MAG: hypothetical protein J6W26_05270 [Bacteroidales bacterium]|nr:hypothetical protein [Bacteroidales bacterium]